MDNHSNEKEFTEQLLNLTGNISKAQAYIKENYHIDSEYDSENDLLYIWSKNVNESLNLAAAKEYVTEEIGEEFVNVIYGTKQ